MWQFPNFTERTEPNSTTSWHMLTCLRMYVWIGIIMLFSLYSSSCHWVLYQQSWSMTRLISWERNCNPKTKPQSKVEKALYSHRPTSTSLSYVLPIMHTSTTKSSARSRGSKGSKTGTEPTSSKDPFSRILTRPKGSTKVRKSSNRSSI